MSTKQINVTHPAVYVDGKQLPTGQQDLAADIADKLVARGLAKYSEKAAPEKVAKSQGKKGAKATASAGVAVVADVADQSHPQE